jgi:hypothetical protein
MNLSLIIGFALTKIISSALCTKCKHFSSQNFAKRITSVLLILCYNDSLFTWTVVSLTSAKFKSLWPCPMFITCSFTWFCVLSVFFQHNFRFLGGRTLHSFLTLIFRILTEGSTLHFTTSCWIPSRFLDVATLIGPCSLCRCCIPFVSNASSRRSVLSRFLWQQGSCLIPDDSDFVTWL